jgi:iron complex transport system substrate-binding protein
LSYDASAERGWLFLLPELPWERPLVLQSEGIFISFEAKGGTLKRTYLALLLIIIMIIAATAACTGTQSGQGTITIIDDAGRHVHLDSVPTRIVSHVPSITETIFALGLGDKLVADDDYSDYPEAAKTKPKIGGYFTPNIEEIVAMKPDLVLTDNKVPDLIPKLDSLGIPVAVIDPKDINGVLTDVDLLGNITGSQKAAEELTSEMRMRIDAVMMKVVPLSYRPSVFYVYDATDPTKPWTAGPGSFVDSLINMAGGHNVAASASGPWIQFNMEELVNANPDIILVDSSHGTAAISPDQLEKLPGWQDLKAVKENQVYTIDGDLVNRSGPRIVQGLEEIAKILHPELFKD